MFGVKIYAHPQLLSFDPSVHLVVSAHADDGTFGGYSDFFHPFGQTDKFVTNLSENFVLVRYIPEVSHRIYRDVDSTTPIRLPFFRDMLQDFIASSHSFHTEGEESGFVLGAACS
jgi:hypothetical protein